MMPIRSIALALCALWLASCTASTADDAAFGQRVRAYLLAHPEVLQEVSEKLDEKQAATEQADLKRAEALLPSLRNAIEHDPRDFAANPAGRVTVTEFYDYRCPHCAEAAPKVIALIHDRPEVRVVFKEMPIFGPVSERAARAAIAVHKAGGNSLGLYEAFMTTRALDEAAIDQIALKYGARPVDLEDSPAAQAQLTQTAALFTKLNLGGTPAFIVGDRIVLGADMPQLNAAIEKALGRGA